MAVLVPLNDSAALPRLQAAGVSEIYVGFHDERWSEHFGNAELNRMSGFGREANPFTFELMCRQLERAAELDMHAFVCFNASQYTPEQLAFIEREYLPEIARSQGCGAIVSGQGLLGAIRDKGLQAVISTVAGTFNSRLVEHYRNRGATRIILPRDLSSDEIARIVDAVPDLEYEVFLMRNGCVFSDSHCLGRHCSGRPSLCLSLREGQMTISPVDERAAMKADNNRSNGDDFIEAAYENERIWATRYHRRTCGLCALWRFEQLGIAAYKVVGRGDDVDDLIADAGLVARNTRLARSCATEQEYLARMELPRDPQTLCGNQGLSCYYPEIGRFANNV